MNIEDLISTLTVRPAPPFPSVVKWGDTTIGHITELREVVFADHGLTIVDAVVGSDQHWDSAIFRDFLEDRVPSEGRRDIQRILSKNGITRYNVFNLARVTRAISAKDNLWLAFTEEEKLEDVLPDLFDSIFNKKVDITGNSIHSPSGVNIKRYAVSNGHYGILKKRLNPNSSDVEAEVIVYEIAKRMGVRCCPSWIVEEGIQRKAFSQFKYTFTEEYIVHIRRLFQEGESQDNLYESLITKLPALKADIERMIVLDFVTRQTDRHLSNMALKLTGNSVSFYDLYDNGRSLFFEDKKELMDLAVQDIALYSSEFGSVGTYYDAVQDIAKTTTISELVNLDLDMLEIHQMMLDCGMDYDRAKGSVEWMSKCIDYLRMM